MCRLFGVAWGPGGPQAEGVDADQVARAMFVAAVDRGAHAFGWMAPDTQGVAVTRKLGRSDAPAAAVHQQLPGGAPWFVGHTRLATVGARGDVRNAHPVRHGHHLGVHNGTVVNYAAILDAVGGRHDPAVEVDSEAVVAAVARWGPSGLGLLRGSAATAWVDTRQPQELWVGRTVRSPLWLGRTEGRTWAFASSSAILDASGLRFTAAAPVTREHVAFTLTGGAATRIVDVADTRVAVA